MDLSDEKTRAFYNSFIGTEAEVLVERPSRGKPANGFTANYIKVEMEANMVKENSLVRVRLDGFNEKGDALKSTII